MQNVEKEICRLLKTILELMTTSRGGWCSWKQVARRHTGSADSAFLLSGLADLPEWRHLFTKSERHVKLSDQGIAMARECAGERISSVEEIAHAVIEYARGLRPIVLDIQEVAVVAAVSGKTIHAIRVELSDEILPADTPVQVTCLESRPIPGKLVGQEPEGDVIYVACDTDILASQMPSKLVIDRANLLTQLADQLQLLPGLPPLMLAMFQPSPEPLIADADSTVVAQRLACLEPPWTRFLWGPPGSGKTYGLGHLVASLLQSCPSETILVVAPSNRAVDVAVNHLRTRLAVNSLERMIRARRILRFGYPRLPEVLEVPELLGPAVLDKLSGRVHRISREIKRIDHEHGKESDAAVLKTELLAAQEAVKEAVREHVNQCAVVATTTTMAYMRGSPVAARSWDTIIVDEVTMVPPAVCVFLASKAKKRLLLAGDPCQLGPIYEQSAQADLASAFWIANDIFSISGASTGFLSARAVSATDSRLARITAQRRCGAEIWNHIDCFYPLVEDASNTSRTRTIAALPPEPDCSVVVVDLPAGSGGCEQVRRSWQNLESARVAMHVVGALSAGAPSPSRIAIICPYRAQVKVLRQLIREARNAEEVLSKKVTVEAGTVHQFQGSEADAVVFDLVDGPGRKGLGMLLRGDAGTRLINVAISRAKGKLVVLADKEWCRSANLPAGNHLLSELIFRGRSIPASRVTEREVFQANS